MTWRHSSKSLSPGPALSSSSSSSSSTTAVAKMLRDTSSEEQRIVRLVISRSWLSASLSSSDGFCSARLSASTRAKSIAISELDSSRTGLCGTGLPKAGLLTAGVAMPLSAAGSCRSVFSILIGTALVTAELVATGAAMALSVLSLCSVLSVSSVLSVKPSEDVSSTRRLLLLLVPVCGSVPDSSVDVKLVRDEGTRRRVCWKKPVSDYVHVPRHNLTRWTWLPFCWIWLFPLGRRCEMVAAVSRNSPGLSSIPASLWRGGWFSDWAGSDCVTLSLNTEIWYRIHLCSRWYIGIDK